MSGGYGELFLGVDGGNTKTVALLADRAGTVLGRAVGGCTDIYGAESIQTALNELDATVLGCCRLAGVDSAEIGRGVFSLAGADWPEDFELLRDAVHERGLARRPRIYNDAFGALRAGTQDFVGVAVVCGTGAATGARSASGGLWHSSFWQEPQGARQLGQIALRTLLRSELGTGPATAMREPILETYQQSSIEALLHALTARGHATLSTEPAARILVSTAESGDPVAVDLLATHGAALGAIALAAARRVSLAPGSFPLVLAGGVLEASPVLQRSVTRAVFESVPAQRVRLAHRSPAEGALLLAFDEERLDVELDWKPFGS